MMSATSFTTRRVTLDFTSSGQAKRSATQLFADGKLFGNAIELTDWSTDPIQVQVCEECGVVHCASGGWVSFRSVGSYALLIPAFAAIADDPAEYRPPNLIAQYGFISFPPQSYLRLRSLVSGLPPPSSLAALSRGEAALMYQGEAPGRVLGVLPSVPHPKASDILAAEPGDAADQVAALNLLLSSFVGSSDPVALQPTPASPVVLYVDMPGVPAWEAFVSGERPSLILAPGLVVGAA
jgi:hypothetical protein